MITGKNMGNSEKNNLAGIPETDEPTPPDGLTDGSATKWIYSRIDEVAKNCRKIYFIYLGLLSYALLTVFTTPSQNLFLGQNVLLPLVKAPVSLHYFLILTPLIAIGIFIYSQLYLLKLNKLIAYAIKTCSNANPNCPKRQGPKCHIYNICEEHRNRLYPWMIIFGKYAKKSFAGKLQIFFVKFSLWAFLPMVLISFSLFVVKKHDSNLSHYLLTITLIGTCVVFAFLRYFQHPEKEISNRPKTRGSVTFLIVVLVAVIFLFFLSKKANEGTVWLAENPWSPDAAWSTKILRHFSLVDLRHKKLTREPAGKQKYDVPYWLNLEGTHLEGANLSSSNLTKANLMRSSLKNAYLHGAILDNADFEQADLDFAVLRDANLKDANLYGAQLCDSDLSSASLQGAMLSNADLRNADLQDANLRGARLAKSNLLFADLRQTKEITIDQLKEALNWNLAKYSPDLIKSLGLPPKHNKNVKEKNLEEYVLMGANLKRADLSEARLKGTILKDADLQWADLRGVEVENLDKEELLRAKNYKLAYYSKEWLAELDLPPDHNDRVKNSSLKNYPLQEADLRNANLHGANLKGAKLHKAQLLDADINGADLSQADLSGADLQEASLRSTNLSNTNLRGANLKNADLSGANLREADLTEANLQGTDLRGIKKITIDQLHSARNCKLALYSRELIIILGLHPNHNDRVANQNFKNYNFKGANLQDADLQGANLSEAQLQNADLRNTILTETDLTEAKLDAADIRGAKLNAANLEKAELVKADLQGVDFWQTNLRSANLSDANLSKAELNEADLKGAILHNADLSEVKLFNANLQYADLRDAKKITRDQLETARNYKLAFYSLPINESLGLPINHADNINERNFSGYDFAELNLRGADFSGVDLRGANLKDADIQYADFIKAKNITKYQLLSARNCKLALYSQELLKIFGLRPHHNENVAEKDFKSYNFSNANLQKADFHKANLKSADFSNANLQGADLRNANLQESKLSDADLRGADLTRADLKYANLTQIDHFEEINLKKAKNWNLAYYDAQLFESLGLPKDHNNKIRNKNFRGYNLVGATLKGADLEDADFVDVILRKADLREANLKNAKLMGANLESANLQKAQLREAKLMRAILDYADLIQADLKEAIFNNASLREADLSGANLSGAEFIGTNLQGADLRGILYSDYKQFIHVETLYQTKMDESLMTQIESEYPSLFKKPVLTN